MSTNNVSKFNRIRKFIPAIALTGLGLGSMIAFETCEEFRTKVLDVVAPPLDPDDNSNNLLR